jgi:hypothetical protein
MTNEERILALLERQEKTLENHGKMLEEHGKMLEEQGKMLADHSKMLADHSKMLERLQVDVSGIKVRLDVEVEKKFQLLAEGHQTLLDALAPKSRVENLEDEMAFLRSIIKTMNEDISTLKKAQ